MHIEHKIDVRQVAAFLAPKHGRSALATRRLPNFLVVAVRAPFKSNAALLVRRVWRKAYRIVRPVVGHRHVSGAVKRTVRVQILHTVNLSTDAIRCDPGLTP